MKTKEQKRIDLDAAAFELSDDGVGVYRLWCQNLATTEHVALRLNHEELKALNQLIVKVARA